MHSAVAQTLWFAPKLPCSPPGGFALPLLTTGAVGVFSCASAVSPQMYQYKLKVTLGRLVLKAGGLSVTSGTQSANYSKAVDLSAGQSVTWP